MYIQIKQPYEPPCVLQTQAVYLDRPFVLSIIQPETQVNTIGQEIQEEGFIDTELDTSFNHEWL